MSAQEEKKQIELLKQTIAESKLAIDNLREVITEVEARLRHLGGKDSSSPSQIRAALPGDFWRASRHAA